MALSEHSEIQIVASVGEGGHGFHGSHGKPERGVLFSGSTVPQYESHGHGVGDGKKQVDSRSLLTVVWLVWGFGVRHEDSGHAPFCKVSSRQWWLSPATKGQ